MEGEGTGGRKGEGVGEEREGGCPVSRADLSTLSTTHALVG